jgi:hypothetical protein
LLPTGEWVRISTVSWGYFTDFYGNFYDRGIIENYIPDPDLELDKFHLDTISNAPRGEH